MYQIPRPMLAFNDQWTPSQIANCYPLLASPKINGERLLVVNGLDGPVALSRSGKPIRNQFIQAQIRANPNLIGLDGEITCGPPTSPFVRRTTRSGVSSFAGQPDFQFHIFDKWNRGGDFLEWHQHQTTSRLPNTFLPDFCTLVPQHFIPDERTLLSLEEQVVGEGWEGLVLRGLHMPYKQNRTTWMEFLRGHGMIKMKRFQDGEAVVLSSTPRMVNMNNPTTSPLGYTERSSAQSGLVPIPQLGSLTVRDILTNKVFNIGTGLGWTDQERTRLWDIRPFLPGTILTYRHFNEGTDGLPYQPIFHAWLSATTTPGDDNA